jgi:hypothetical protein
MSVHTDPFWVGRFSQAIAMNLPKIKTRPEEARENLKRCLDDFLRSSLPDAEHKRLLREELRQK